MLKAFGALWVGLSGVRFAVGGSEFDVVDGNIDRAAMRRLGLRRTELEHAVRIQNGDSTDDVQLGLLEPTGQLILRLTHDAEPATRGDLASVLARLDSIDRQLTAARGHDQGANHLSARRARARMLFSPLRITVVVHPTVVADQPVPAATVVVTWGRTGNAMTHNLLRWPPRPLDAGDTQQNCERVGSAAGIARQ